MSSRVIPHYEMQQDFEKLFEFKSKERAHIDGVAQEGHEFLQNEKEKCYFSQLSHEQKKRFLQLYKKACCDGEFVRLKFKRAVGATIRKFQLFESATSIPSQKPYYGYIGKSV